MRFEVGHAGLQSRPRLPSRARDRGVVEQLSMDRIADPTAGADGFSFRLALGDFAVEERSTG